MNNEELKKKIVEIINDGIIHGEDNCGVPTSKTIESIADALIAAGIGDVKEVEKGYRDAIFLAVKSQTMTSERSRYIELNKNIAEHRAKVAERAFSKLVHEMYEHGIRPMCDEKFFVESRLKDAEKELAEEGKND